MTIGFQDNTGLYIDKQVFKDKLKAVYTLQNLEKKKLLSRGEVWRARNLPDFHEIYWNKEKGVQVPLGILGTSWGDYIERRQNHEHTLKLQHSIELYPEQVEVLEKLRKKNVGLLEASTGVGKSYMILYLAATLKRKTLIIVNSTVTLKEMVEKSQALLDITPIVVGGTKKYKPTTNDITICLIHSIGKLNLLSYGAILADECDLYISTDIRQQSWYSCSPDYLYAFSATTELNNQEKRLINLFFGNVAAKIESQNFIPTIKMIPTRYQYPGTLDSDGEFSKMMTDISENRERNELIIKTIYETLPQTEMKKGLLLVKRTEQAEIFKKMLDEKGIKSFIIIGETKEEERKEILVQVKAMTEAVVLIGSAQILGRGFDCPPLQNVYISYPNKFDAALIQVCGRVLRKYPGKSKAYIYDFCDSYETMLRNQFYARKKVYKKKYGVIV